MSVRPNAARGREDAAFVTTTRRRLADLVPTPWNPRRISAKARAGLARSMDEFGLVQPIVVNTRTGHVVGGHQRLAILVERGVVETDVIEVDLAESKEKALNIALNSPAIAGEFTEDLQGLLADLARQEEDLFAGLLLGELLVPTEVTTDPALDEAPPLPKVAVAKLGEVWQLGEHRLACGSCTDPDLVGRLMGDRMASCMWTDPPYGVAYDGGPHPGKNGPKQIKNDAMSHEQLGVLLANAFMVADPLLARGAGIYVAHPSMPGLLHLVFLHALVAARWTVKQELLWIKDRVTLSQADYHPVHEMIAYAFKPVEKGRHGRFGRHGRIATGGGWYGDDKQRTVFDIPKPQRSDLHPTMKPVELVARMVANSTKPGGLVYEPFAGSGTTLIACESLGRVCAAVELDPRYVDVIVERWQTQSGGKAVRAGAKPPRARARAPRRAAARAGGRR